MALDMINYFDSCTNSDFFIKYIRSFLRYVYEISLLVVSKFDPYYNVTVIGESRVSYGQLGI